MHNRCFIIILAMMVLLPSCESASPDIIELSFATTHSSAHDDEKTINSIEKVGNFYTVNYSGDYEERLQWLQQYHLQMAADLDAKNNCSLFTVTHAIHETIVGRNFDRRGEIPVLAKFSPPGKYSSIAFSPFSEVHLKDIVTQKTPSQDQIGAFLTSLPFYPTDGINEKGLTVCIAGAPARNIQKQDGAQLMFVLHFLRCVLDNCQNIDEAARLAETVNLYDRSTDIISHHIMITDKSGAWLVIDYPDGSLRITKGKDDYQIRTNHFLEGGPAIPEAPSSFSRYDTIDKRLSSPEPLSSPLLAMKLLDNAKDGTAWSVIYEPFARKGLIAVQENYDTLYQFGFSADNE